MGEEPNGGRAAWRHSGSGAAQRRGGSVARADAGGSRLHRKTVKTMLQKFGQAHQPL